MGDKLPIEAELVENYGVSRSTIREGLASLVDEGRLIQAQADYSGYGLLA